MKLQGGNALAGFSGGAGVRDRLIEVAIAACLQEVPVWVHAVVAAVQLVAGQSAQSGILPVVYFDLCVCGTDTAGSKSVMIRPL